MKQFIIFILILTIAYSQFGLFGCFSAFNLDAACPINRTFQINILVGMDEGADSDSLDITVNFQDKMNNVIGSLPLKWPNCNPYQKGNVDTIKGCANWVELAKSVTFNIAKSDQMQVQALTVSLGQKTSIQTKFWFDDKSSGYLNNWPVFSKLQLYFK